MHEYKRDQGGITYDQWRHPRPTVDRLTADLPHYATERPQIELILSPRSTSGGKKICTDHFYRARRENFADSASFSDGLGKTGRSRHSWDMIHERLRHATRQAHERLEARLDLLDHHLTLPRYIRVLERFLGFYRPWEARLADLLDDPPFFEPRRRVFLLESDLAALGHGGAVPECPELPPLKSVAAALGGFYVTEGSTLGGQVLARHAAAHFGWPDGFATAFYASRGRDVGAAWRAFKARLERESSPAADQAMVDAALATFATLEDWLTPA